MHAVPLRAAGTVIGALGLFGTHTRDLDDADLLVAQEPQRVIVCVHGNGFPPGPLARPC